MAQLGDCFAHDGELLTIEAVHRLIAARVAPVEGLEEAPIADAGGRVLAGDLRAGIDLPPFANSAVDGYAVAHARRAGAGETLLPIEGRATAGGRLAPPEAGRALRIFTGAPVPPGYDTIFMQEDCRLAPDGAVRLPAGLGRGANLRLAGEDIGAGDLAIAAGTRLSARHVALAAALGRERLSLRRRLRARVFSSGDELVAAGETLRGGAIHDANRPMLLAMLRGAGLDVEDGGMLPDSREATAAALREASRRADLIVATGGVSTGEEDHVRAAAEAEGGLVFWRIAIKPGRPVALARIGGAVFAGLPGNPAAAWVTAAFVLRPLIAALSGEVWSAPRALPIAAGFSCRKKAGRREYIRASLVEAGGVTMARRFPRDGAGLITSLTSADGLVELGEARTSVTEGEPVGFIPFSALF